MIQKCKLSVVLAIFGFVSMPTLWTNEDIGILEDTGILFFSVALKLIIISSSTPAFYTLNYLCRSIISLTDLKAVH